MRKHCFTPLSKKGWRKKRIKPKLIKTKIFVVQEGKKKTPHCKKMSKVEEKLLMAKPLNSFDLNPSAWNCSLMPSCYITSYLDQHHIKTTARAGTIHLTINPP